MTTTKKNEYYFIVDQSGSMNYFNFNKITDFKNELVGQDEIVHWLPFASHATYYKNEKFNVFSSLGYTTHFEYALVEMSKLVFDDSIQHHIIIITDGCFNNPVLVKSEAEKLCTRITNLNFHLLRIGSSAEVGSLFPFFSKTETNNIYDLDLNFNYKDLDIKFKSKIEIQDAVYYPWDTNFKTILVFPTDIYYKNGDTVSNADITKYVEKFTKNEKLKMLNSNFDQEQSKKDIEIVKLFIETFYKNQQDTNNTRKGFYLKTRNNLDFLLTHLKSIDKQVKFDSFNEQQKADFLRKLDISNATMKRGMKVEENLDLKKTVITDIRNIIDHRNILLEIQSDNEFKSMISLETTLDSLLYLSEQSISFFKEKSLLELLKMINIVGIAVNTIIGDFPDPKTWHINTVSNVYTSVADIIYNSELSQKLMGPDKIEITNVIPVFMNTELFTFCNTYMKNTMNLICGFGMRRVLMIIPQTFRYTILNGFTESIQKGNDSEWNWNIVNSLSNQIVKLSKKRELKPPVNDNYIDLDNDKLSDILLNIVESHSKYLPEILRNLYSLEYALFASKYLSRNNLTDPKKRKEFILKLLSVDLTIDNTFDIYKSDQLNSFVKQLKYFDSTLHISKAYNTCLESYKNIQIDFKKELELQDITFREFKHYILIQGFLFKNKSERYIDDKINVKDIFKKKVGDEMITKFVEDAFKQEQNTLESKRRKNEMKIIARQVGPIFTTSTFAEFKTFVSEKIKTVQFLGISKLFRKVFTAQKNRLLENDTEKLNSDGIELKNIVDFNEKVKWFVCGGDVINGFWNNGNCVTFLIKYVTPEIKNDVLHGIRRWNFRKNNMPNRHGNDSDTINDHIILQLTDTELKETVFQ